MNQVAQNFILSAVQDWGQSKQERIAAVQALLDEAGFRATATCWPVFGGIWGKPCDGDDAEEATEWLRRLTDTMPRGRFEGEVGHIEDALKARVS